MCGIAGRVNLTTGQPVDAARIGQMCQIMAHRGPDGQGVYADGPVGLGHRRLAIIDLSDAAAQPMHSADGRFSITFNGEIYNFAEIRADLERRGYRFRTSSDTEVLLASYEVFGVDCLAHLRGMFAFAIWDVRERRLFAARDRVGKKPLYYRVDRDGLAFASEPKAFFAEAEFDPQPDPQALWLYLSYGYVPAPWSAFQGVRQLPPGHYLTFAGGQPDVQRYWKLRYRPKFSGSEEDALRALDDTLTESVRLRMISDVPLGAFLSGGIDSSTIVALMARLSSTPIKTFSIGFEDQKFDELQYARMVAERFGTDHHELVVRPDALDVLPTLVWHYGEPFADSSAIPSYYVAKITREHVTVALNGDGGDESFAGYTRYTEPPKAAAYARLPRAGRAMLAAAFRSLPPSSRSDSVLARAQRWTEVMSGPAEARYTQAMMPFDAELRRRLCAPDFMRAVGDVSPEAITLDVFRRAVGEDDVDAMLAADVETYLPGDILRKVDIATMANSLEGRSPLLDHELMEFAASLPMHLKLRDGRGKHLLRRLAETVLPPELLSRPKKGFSVPMGRWLRHDLKELVHDTLLDGRARTRHLFREGAVDRFVREHEHATYDWHVQVYTLLMLELWFRQCVEEGRGVGSAVTASQPAFVAGGSR